MAKVRGTTLLMLLLLALLPFIVNYNSAFGVDVLESKRENNMKIAADENAFIGIKYDKLYQIAKGEKINFTIENNFPYTVDYVLNLEGKAIDSFEPNEFSLQPGDSKIIEIKSKSSLELGDYPVQGNISALLYDGNSKVEFDFIIKINN